MRNLIRKPPVWLGIFFSIWFVYFTYFWSHAFVINQSGGLSATNGTLWGDWAAHFTMGSHMAYNDLWPETSPLLINQPFDYPFIANWLSALAIRAGVPFFFSFVVPSYLCSLAIVGVLFYFYSKLFSKRVAAMGTTLFLLSGGLGFVYFIQDVFSANNALQTILNPPREYTHLYQLGFHWSSMIDTMIIPQRAYVLGLPLALFALTTLISLYNHQKISRFKILVTGVIFGLLPLIHTHSFIAVALISSIWFIAFIAHKKNHSLTMLKPWLIIAILAFCISAPKLLMLLSTHGSSTFMSWAPGWYANQKPEQNWFIFWIRNWGVVPILAILGLRFTTTKTKQALHGLAFLAPFIVLFGLSNLFSFQPNLWDNTKLLAWVSVGFSGFAAYALEKIWINIKQLKISRSAIVRNILYAAAILLFIVSVFTGAIDAFRLTRFQMHTYQMYSKEDLELAEWVKQYTPNNSVWLTSDQHNHWLYNLTGRQPLMAYEGWLWSHGYDYWEIKTDLELLLSKPETNSQLFKKYGIAYAVIGPHERQQWKAKKDTFATLFPIEKQTTNYTIFKIEQH